jgi:hypothetical protein
MTPLFRLKRDFRVPAAIQQGFWAVVVLLENLTAAYARRCPSGEVFRTRVRFPPSPPKRKRSLPGCPQASFPYQPPGVWRAIPGGDGTQRPADQGSEIAPGKIML